MAYNETFQAIIKINNDQAKNKVEELRKEQKAAAEELSRLKQKDSKATKEQIELAEKRLKIVSKSLQEEIRHAKGLDAAMQQLSKKTYKDLQSEVRVLNKMMRDGTVEKNSDEWYALAERIKEARREMREYEDATKEVAKQAPLWKRFITTLNTHWGAITQIIGAVTGLTVAIRSSVKAHAEMEEAMADARKYTGMTDAAIRDLNEDLKKMETRTGREELNELAGAAGRLGKTSKKDILEFVEAGNMIKVALGDDLGEGAIDKVGKLAMAFGEDDRMGLRGAMLATGSAVNELAQNSSAQAGYLVDFTARVAGFGKQLGLTQAQIMGFGAVMDENLLRDEMAATAFGNMLTKMQTDTEKFARIAGMNVKEFTDLLNKDANAAILALADNLKKADPQNMMKMLDDMGLDGSRAVGVLSTLADKIDDVRQRQQLATQAYKEGVSVQKEYNTMNNTVEAGIEKAKKQFMEMTVELGEKLMPLVKYTISSSALLIKALAAIVSFLFQNISAITKLSIYLAEYVAIKKLHYLWTQRSIVLGKIELALNKAGIAVHRAWIGWLKLRTIAMLAWNGAITKSIALQRIWNEVLKKNPIGLAVTAVALLTAGVMKLVDVLGRQEKKQKLVNDLNKTAIEKTAEERAEIERLVEKARDQNEQLDKRKEAIEKLNEIIPGYNGHLDETTGKYYENARALETYNSLLMEKYRLEAAEEKIKDIERKKFQADLEYEERMRKSREREAQGGTFLTRWGQTQGTQTEGSVSEKGFQEQITREHEKQTNEYEKQLEIVKGIKKDSQEIVNFGKQVADTMENQRKILEGDDSKKTDDGKKPSSPYKSAADEKKEEQERRKREAEARQAEAERIRKLKEADKEEKAITDTRLAENMLAYQAGLKNYREYTAEQVKIQEEGMQARMKVWGEGTAEYAKYQKQLTALQLGADNAQTKMKLSDYERIHVDMLHQLEKDYQTSGSAIYRNEAAYREARFQEEMDFLENKKNLYRKGSLERMQIEWQIEDRMYEHQLENEQFYQERLQDLKTTYLQQSDTEREQMELNALDDLHQKGLLKEEEYQRALLAIKAQYASGQTPDQKTAAAGTDMLKVASAAAASEAKSGTDIPITGTVTMYMATMDKLKELYGQDEKNHEAYLSAKMQATSQFCQQLAAEFQAAFDSVNQIMSAASSYYSAQQDYETAQVQKKYEKQIAAAGNNQKKVKKLQEKQAKEEAEIKTKYNRKQVKIQIAQALAQTATNALNAYGSAAAVPVVGYILAPIAAAMAVAAGMLQVAAIKKQAAAQEAGYYEGGFTGGKRYRKEAGVVHEGEFVANHQAVNNPNVLPMLQFLDRAQRNNTVGSLTAEDISRQIGSGGTAVVAPVVNVQADNKELRSAIDGMNEATQGLVERLDEGIEATVAIDGPKGLHKQYQHYLNLLKK